MDPETISTDHQEEGEFVYLRRELRRRTAEFPKSFTFFAYVVAGVVMLGGLGIWTELLLLTYAPQDRVGLDGVFTAVATFYPAVAGSASFQLLLIAAGKLDRVLTGFGILVIVFSIAAAFLLTFFRAAFPTSCLIAAVILATFSIWVWIVTNADDPIYKSVSVDAPSGGSTSREPKGDLSEFKVN